MAGGSDKPACTRASFLLSAVVRAFAYATPTEAKRCVQAASLKNIKCALPACADCSAMIGYVGLTAFLQVCQCQTLETVQQQHL